MNKLITNVNELQSRTFYELFIKGAHNNVWISNGNFTKDDYENAFHFDAECGEEYSGGGALTNEEDFICAVPLDANGIIELKRIGDKKKYPLGHFMNVAESIVIMSDNQKEEMRNLLKEVWEESKSTC